MRNFENSNLETMRINVQKISNTTDENVANAKKEFKTVL